MVDKIAQNELDTKYGINKATQQKIEEDGTTDQWTGELVIDGYTALKEIDITDNKITKLVIKNCPKLKKVDINGNKINVVDLSGIGANNVFEELFANDNQLTELNLKSCAKIKELKIRENATLTEIKGLEDIKDINELDITNTPNVRLVHEDKFGDYEQTKEAIKDLLGGGNLPDSVKNNGKIDKGKLENELKNKVAGSVKNEKDQAENEKNNLQQQLNAIKTELGLGNGATQQQIIDKIKELKGRPTNTHADYDAIKAKRDTLKTKNTQLKNRKNDDNKENISKGALRDTTNTSFEKWEIKLSDGQKQSLNSAASAQKVEEIRSGIINGEIGKLRSENSSSTKLNIGLGVLTFGTLLLLGWVLMRQADLPETEPEKEK